jgi:hypothetical protein
MRTKPEQQICHGTVWCLVELWWITGMFETTKLLVGDEEFLLAQVVISVCGGRESKMCYVDRRKPERTELGKAYGFNPEL